MRYRKKTHTIEAFRVNDMGLTIHSRKGNKMAAEGDMILIMPDGTMECMQFPEFQKFYEME